MTAAATTGGGRPKKYELASGQIVPGVTTILGKFKEPGALMHWAWSLGREGKDYRKERDGAAGIGHEVHALIDASVHGRELPPASEAAAMAFEAFLDWRKMVSLEILDTERPLVSELHAYGGTYDALALVCGKRMLLDWKSSNDVYPEHVAQLAAYRQLIRESLPTAQRELAPEAACLLRVSKASGNFSYHYFTSATLDLAWERFRASAFLMQADRALKEAL